MKNATDLEAAVAWLRAEAEKTSFGSVALEIVMHDGRVAKIGKSTTVSVASPTGGSSPLRKRKDAVST